MIKRKIPQKELQRIRNLILKRDKDKTYTSVGFINKQEIEENKIYNDEYKSSIIIDNIKYTIRKNKNKSKLFCPKCNGILNTKNDLKMIKIHDECFDCTIAREQEIRLKGEEAFREYEKDIILKNIKYTTEIAKKGLEDLKKELEYDSVISDESGHTHEIPKILNEKINIIEKNIKDTYNYFIENKI